MSPRCASVIALDVGVRVVRSRRTANKRACGQRWRAGKSLYTAEPLHQLKGRASGHEVGFRDELHSLHKMNDEYSISIEGYPLTALAKRRDRPWGHAIDVSIIEANGSTRGEMVFACHPEFLAFDEFQAMSTEALIDLVRKRLPAAIAESLSALDSGVTTLFRFNSPDDRWVAEIAGLATK